MKTKFIKYVPICAYAVSFFAWSAFSEPDLAQALRQGDTKKSLDIINNQTDINSPKSQAPILLAVLFENKPVVDLLIAKKADLNARSAFNSTALHYAAYFGNKAIAEALINAGADVKAHDNFKNTPLHYSHARNHADISRLLIEKGASQDAENKIPDLSSSDIKFKPTLLSQPIPDMDYLILFSDDADLVKALLEKKPEIDINKKVEGVSLPISASYIFNRPAIREALKAKGADFSKVDLWLVSQGRTNKEAFRDLLEITKPDLKKMSPEGFTLLQDAIYEGNPELVELIVEKGADLSQALLSGRNILDEAIFHAIRREQDKLRRFEIVDFFFGKNIKPNKAQLHSFLESLVDYVAGNERGKVKHEPTPLIKKLFERAIAEGADKNNKIFNTPARQKAIQDILAQ